VSKKGLPSDLKMRHDSHYVDELARTNRTVGRKILINLLEPNPDQPRTEIGDLSELSDSIKQKGVLEPILVKPNSKSGTWMIIAGERRWRAANLAGLLEVPCIELDIDEKDIAEIALIENLQRKDLTLWEEADGFAYLIQKFGYTHEEIAKKIGKSRTTVTESLAIAGLPESIRAKCRQAELNTKSALLEVARQFDEKAMHNFLENNRKKSLNNESAYSKSNSNNRRSVKSPAVSENSKSPVNSLNTFKYVSVEEDFNLEISFNKKDKYSRDDILAALKKVFNEIKA
jgi:ParB family chromosome partitioning protein